MSPSSFKRDLGQRPQYYRTPSPPSFAFEPISPIHNENFSAAHKAPGQDGAHLHNGTNMDSYALHAIADWEVQKGNSSSTMDAFASIALAITTANQGQAERPSKRARSEKLRSPEWTRTEPSVETRPVTSYEQLSDSRTLEAELLLNFSHEARFSASWKQIKHTNPNHSGEHHRSVSDQVQFCHLGPTYNDGRRAETFSPIPAEPLPATDTEIISSNYGNSPNVPIIVRQGSTTAHAESTRREDCMEICAGEEASKYSSAAGVQIFDSGHQTPELNHPPMIDSLNLPHSDCHREIALTNGTSGEIAKERNLVPLPDEHEAVSSGSVTTERLYLSSGDGEGSSDYRKLNSTPKAISNTEVRTEVKAVLQPHVERPESPSTGDAEGKEPGLRPAMLPAICSACHFTRNSPNVDTDSNSTSWISCDGCKSWFHFACAGFKNEREVRGVDKYRCRTCKPIYGSTTYVRKSSRAHSAIDYAGLNEGVLKTSDERPEHHYIKPIKDGIITFLPDNFARMRPEWVTAEYFEKGSGMKEPLVIPAHLNPQPRAVGVENVADGQEDPEFLEEWLTQGVEYQSVPDHGQDGLDMVMPQDLTVRLVADLYGPEEKVEVIDVKSQNGEGKKWNMRRWADYYESSSNKAVRNVISLEVSQSKLGRLIRRPQIVRDLDLQDSVWPHELQAKGEYPRVQLYCLMSVADCFTDFHIDFGGSSVFYHILKGKKTFLFIPPKEKHLKKYEEWCMSPAQNWTFLADQTKECYRVDLAEGDTMLIPAGWIHAVWTPEDSLVIGGNFLTRMHYGMQFRISQIEKSTGVARKFRYPQFQRLHWYTALQYLDDDPLPDSVREILQEGGAFHREKPAHYAFDDWGENSISGVENYHARYYSQAELEGIPELTRYLLRTALIDLGSITEGITLETRNAVKRAIPRGYGEPLDIVKGLALWCAWKRGNEPIPHWAYPHAVPEGGASDSTGKLSAAALKRLDQEAALQAPRRQSARRQTQLQLSAKASVRDVVSDCQETKGDDQTVPDLSKITITTAAMNTPSKRRFSDIMTQGPSDVSPSDSSKKQRRRSKSGPGSHRKPACESCRKRRRACRHRDLAEDPADGIRDPGSGIARPRPILNRETLTEANNLENPIANSIDAGGWGNTGHQETFEGPNGGSLENQVSKLYVGGPDIGSNHQKLPGASQGTLQPVGSNELKSSTLAPESKNDRVQSKEFDTISGSPMHSRGRTKACNDCRKSKRRCIHDELGNEDPVKARAAAIPRPAATLKRRKLDTESPNVRSMKELGTCPRSESFDPDRPPSAQVASLTHPSQVAENCLEVIVVAEQNSSHSNMVKSEPVPLTSSCHESADVQFQARADAPDDKSSCLVANTLEVADHDSEAEQLIEETQDGEYETAIAPGTRQNQPVHHQFSDPEETENQEQPAASSLVSPPASSHDDIGKSPLPSQAELTPSTSSSRHSSRNPKQVRRYTPESGPARRTSSSSVGEAVAGKSALGDTAHSTIQASPVYAMSRRESRTDGCLPDIVADEESLKLIKELQAEEHGLRRRRRS